MFQKSTSELSKITEKRTSLDQAMNGDYTPQTSHFISKRLNLMLLSFLPSILHQFQNSFFILRKNQTFC